MASTSEYNPTDREFARRHHELGRDMLGVVNLLVYRHGALEEKDIEAIFGEILDQESKRKVKDHAQKCARDCYDALYGPMKKIIDHIGKDAWNKMLIFERHKLLGEKYDRLPFLINDTMYKLPSRSVDFKVIQANCQDPIAKKYREMNRYVSYTTRRVYFNVEWQLVMKDAHIKDVIGVSDRIGQIPGTPSFTGLPRTGQAANP